MASPVSAEGNICNGPNRFEAIEKHLAPYENEIQAARAHYHSEIDSRLEKLGAWKGWSDKQAARYKSKISSRARKSLMCEKNLDCHEAMVALVRKTAVVSPRNGTISHEGCMKAITAVQELQEFGHCQQENWRKMLDLMDSDLKAMDR